MIERIISGGQTGVDLAAWVVAKSYGIPTGGWMPKGFLTEAGFRPEYAKWWGAKEHDDPGYPERTRANVMEADYTLVLGSGRGSSLAYSYVRSSGSQGMHVVGEGLREAHWESIAASIQAKRVKTLNVAGPRGSRMGRDELKLIDRILERIFNYWVSDGYHHIPDLCGDTDELYDGTNVDVGDRVSGNCVCPFCGRLFYDHPVDRTRLGHGTCDPEPYMNVLCSGRIVKL